MKCVILHTFVELARYFCPNCCHRRKGILCLLWGNCKYTSYPSLYRLRHQYQTAFEVTNGMKGLCLLADMLLTQWNTFARMLLSPSSHPYMRPDRKAIYTLQQVVMNRCNVLPKSVFLIRRCWHDVCHVLAFR